MTTAMRKTYGHTSCATANTLTGTSSGSSSSSATTRKISWISAETSDFCYPNRIGRPSRSPATNLTNTGSSSSLSVHLKRNEDVAKLTKYIDDNIIGKNSAFLGPFGRRKVVLCDYIASGRSLQFIEDYILKEVLPCYGNTHSTTTSTSLQSSLFRQDARDIIKQAVNASEEDAVIFVGHGCSGAVRKLVNALELIEAPIVFVGASEHQDNLQIWQEIGAKIIRIAETKQNHLDLEDLADQLRLYQSLNKPLIGCFAATSSVTGVLIDDVSATMLLHQYGALAFWDYNLAAPYVDLDMNPRVPGFGSNVGGTIHEDETAAGKRQMSFKDAMYFSGHKFVGGVQTPGILVAKKSLFKKSTPCEPEGFFALHQQHYKNFEIQEEGSSAAVIESVRAGLVMQLKETVTAVNILARQEKITKQFLQHIRTIPEVILLGNSSPGLKRIPVFSFMVRHPRSTFLHHNFVVAILNDVFGIQARGGCPCSAPYAQDLLGIDDNLATQYESIILEDRRLNSLNLSMESSHLELLRPGFTRLSLPYFINDGELAFIMEAVKMVATEGWKLLPQYVVDLNTGEWRHHTHSTIKERKCLGSIRYVDGKMAMSERRISGLAQCPQSYSECLQTARNLFNRARRMANRNTYQDQGLQFDARAEKLRWFMLQQEAQDILTSNSQNIKHNVPFSPIGFSGCKRVIESATLKGVQENAPASSASSPRHFSLPAIDDHRIITCSSPVPYFVQEVQTAPAGPFFYPPVFTTHHGPVNFAVGDPVTSAAIISPSPQNPIIIHRERCFSLGAPNISSPILSPQTRINLGMTRPRYCTYNSQTDFQSLDSVSNDTASSPTHSLHNVLSTSFEYNQCASVSPVPSDLQTYLTEITKELATNIKSEIREVINTVEDCLENTDSVDMMYTFDKHGSGSEDGRSDSISANEVAEYLKEVSKEMANEVKYEIRDVVNSVDEYFTPEKRSYSRASSSGESDKSQQNKSDRRYTPSSSSETVINIINKSNSATRLTDLTDTTTTDKSCHNCKPKNLSSGVTSLSSQDSGINLTFHEHDSSNLNSLTENRRSNSELTSLARTKPRLERHSEREDMPDGLVGSSGQVVEDNNSHGSDLNMANVSQQSNGEVLKGVNEAVSEFNMIQENDKVLVCLGGDSLCLLHSLLEYQLEVGKKMNFTIGAVIVDPDENGYDPCVLIPYLKRLGVHYILDNQNPSLKGTITEDANENLYSFCSSSIRRRLYATAKCGGYNVLAIGQHYDDLVEGFVISMFDRGQLKTLKAHYFIREHNLRVIRPHIYIHEDTLRRYSLTKNIPDSVLTDNNLHQQQSVASINEEVLERRKNIRELIKQQSQVYSDLYSNLRRALKPLIGFGDVDIIVKKLANTIKQQLSVDDNDAPLTDEEIQS